MNQRAKRACFQLPFPVLSGLLVVLSLAFFPLSQGSILADLPEVVLPLGVSLGIALYSVRLLQMGNVDMIKRTEQFGWIGALIASVGFWIVSQQVQHELSVTLLLDEALTVMSVGSGIGVVLGTQILHEHRSEDRPTRDRVLAETVWTNESRPNPILNAVTTQIAELEGVEPVELQPLYEHINPDVFTELREHDGSEWQVLFYTEDYEVRVSGQGTVTIYDTDSSGEQTA
ncbi:HalOD1 output domain-containing protein [Haloarcula laminariae]|uniref:HalOD1 output domain-containing protein n=1 Tax=Haloarcula laminariae TaxID=2961577 RepID=UPI0024051094|nr:HalOD1 output domain-containing protein [Halomicroarcula sp. FL173]